MKLKVIKPFVDKYDHKNGFKVGDVVEWTDKERIADCINRNLVEEIPAPAEDKKDEQEEKPKPKKKKSTKEA